MKTNYFTASYLYRSWLKRLFIHVIRIYRNNSIDKTLYKHTKFIFKNRKRRLLENPDLKLLNDFFPDMPELLSPSVCELKLVNKIISETLNDEYRMLLGMYMANYNYHRIAKEMDIPVILVKRKIKFIRKTLSDKLSEF